MLGNEALEVLCALVRRPFSGGCGKGMNSFFSFLNVFFLFLNVFFFFLNCFFFLNGKRGVFCEEP